MKLDKKEKININMNGKEFLEYTKYKDSRKIKWTTKNKTRLIVIIIILTVALTLLAIIDMLTYEPSTPINFTWNGIKMFLVICIGIAWVSHGFGFILVRR